MAAYMVLGLLNAALAPVAAISAAASQAPHSLLATGALEQASTAAPRAKGAAPKVYGFSVSAGAAEFEKYDWSLLNGVGWAEDAALIRIAHAKGAKVELRAQGGVADVISDPRRRRAWIQDKLALARQIGADGVNFDLEVPAAPGARAAADYTSLVSEAAAAFRAAVPRASISVDVPWSPYDVDGRNYDWHGLAEAADTLFVMAYDTQSQILGRCIASANSPVDAVRRGLRQWVELGVPKAKLVLGLPWYGYDYPCEPDPVTGAAPTLDTDICRLKPVPFQGASCSDAAGSQKCYSEIMAMLAPGGVAANSTVRRDATQGAPYFNYRAGDGRIHQVWFDDPQSLLPKYQIAAAAGAAGVGFWNLDCLAHGSGDAREQRQTREMWAAVRAGLAGPPAAAARRRRA